jgi:hypothetical protein
MIGKAKDGSFIYAVKMGEDYDEGHFLSEEEMLIRRSDFPDDMVFILYSRIPVTMFFTTA